MIAWSCYNFLDINLNAKKYCFNKIRALKNKEYTLYVTICAALCITLY